MKKTVLITGATSGIGKACATRYASEGFRVILTGRRQDRLDEIAARLLQEYQTEIRSLCFDVQNKKQVDEALGSLPEAWKQIDILINNAGLALGRDSFDNASMDDWETMLNTNVHGLLYVTRAVLPGMIQRRSGHIINMGSIAGKQVYQQGNVYCASKSAVDALSEAMRIDLLPHRIRVTAIHPGAVETEFSLVRFKGDAEKASTTYQGYTPLKPEDIAETCFYCTSLPAHVCINDLVITCTSQANAFYLQKDAGKQ